MKLKIVILSTFLCFAQCKSIKLSCEQIRQFVDGHNSRRLMLAKGKVPGHPAATRMPMMVWDEELSQKAAKWAATHKFSHNPDKTIPSGRFKVGENIQRYYTTDMDFEYDVNNAVRSWFSEYANYTYAPLASSDFSKPYHIGHYTQMIWANSLYVGCGISQIIRDGWNNFYVVCNYGPTGNYIGEYPYESGDPSHRLVCAHEDNCRQIYGPRCS